MKNLILIAALFSVSAQALPSKLVIGYQDEGKVEATLKVCQEVASGVMGDVNDDNTLRVCNARRNHVDAYGELQMAYELFTKTIATDRRLQADRAAAAIARLVKSCIDFRSALTTGGHNIGIDIIPNEIAAKCLKQGTNMLQEQSIKYMSPDAR